MKKYLLPQNGNFYKANLHCHSTCSDGRLTPEELKKLYQSMGYSVLAITDHDKLISHPELSDEEFLALNGYELSVAVNPKDVPFPEQAKRMHPPTCHIGLIALEQRNIVQPDFQRVYDPESICRIMQEGREKGFFVIYNHPTWSCEGYEDYIHYEGMHAFEISNYSCQLDGYEEYNSHIYDDFLRKGRKLFAVAADDNHNAAPQGTSAWDSGGGFIMIKADNLQYRTITKALEEGIFYASEGPEIKELWYEDGEIFISCSPAKSIAMGTDWRMNRAVFAKEGATLTNAKFKIPQECSYFRFIVTDTSGRHANTNAYYISDIIK